MSHEAHLVPRNKFDLDAVERAQQSGYPAVAPVLGELLEWIQDGNWPVAGPLFKFLPLIGEPLVPYLNAVFAGDDDVWKHQCVVLASRMPLEAQRLLLPDLNHMASHPSKGEIEEDVEEEAQLLLDRVISSD